MHPFQACHSERSEESHAFRLTGMSRFFASFGITVLLCFITSTASAQRTPQDSSAWKKRIDSIIASRDDSTAIMRCPIITIDSTVHHPIPVDYIEVTKILTTAPSVYTHSQSGLDIGHSFVNIRGFDQSRITFLLNGISQNDPEDHSMNWTTIPDLVANMYQVEFQNVPCANFNAPPSMAGWVNVRTDVVAKQDFSIIAGYGDYNTSKLGANFNSGLIGGKYIIDASLSQLKSDGYRDASFIDEKSYRLSLVRLDSDFTLQLNFYGGPIKDGLNYYGIFPGDNNDRSNFTDPVLRKINWSETFLYERRAPEYEEFLQPHYEAITSWNINRQTTFYNTLFYIQGDGFSDYDGTWVAPHASDYFRLTSVYGFRYNFTGINDTSLGNELIRSAVSEHQFGWLPRIEYQSDHQLFSVSGEFRIHRSDHWGQLLSAERLPVGLPDNYHFYEYNGGKDIISGFISEQYFTDKLKASAGVHLIDQDYRFFNEKPFFLDSAAAALRGVPQTGWTSYQFTVPLFFVNPQAGLDIDFNDFWKGFISAASTTREPELRDYYNAEFFSLPNFNRNANGSFNFSDPKIKPEHLFDLEIGTGISKYLLDDEVLFGGSITAYYMPFTEELLQTGRVDQFGSPIIANAEKVDHYGIELNSQFFISNSVMVKLNFTASHNEIKEFSQYSDTVNVMGKEPVGFPSIIAGASIFLMPVSGFTFSLTGRYIGAMYGDLTNSDLFRNDPYGVIDGMFAYREKNILGLQYVEVRVQIDNILNTFYTSYVESGTGFFVAAPRHGFATIQIGL